ncbi:Tubulin-tyrosine ligase family protein [Tritrichomonas foetus]|uniref:Tubulin-tyrosine ligase family protein n=1 Tax=Tritrichomonas foetus TaxID=1144522 RepID=A0A1J4KWF7_9EUKA|nr:Tubulin-tyrosine ligase family protein [Tritrichomonas foetus]|eukprot:OHT14038.1 Tubulin-tyrosine ligase family protein [Tritrichomonas foetus]
MHNASCLHADESHIKYDSVKEAMDNAGVILKPNNRTSVLVWYDSLTDNPKIFEISPWQVINRIPCINTLCRKVPFAFVIQKIQKFYPELYSFVPKTFVLPNQSDDFINTQQHDGFSYIIKPNAGSLGKGISIIEPKQSDFSLPDQWDVAQQYIEGLHLDNTKFDLRVYVLVASIRPLRIYVYRDGIARFCSEDATHNSPYSKLTNVTLNNQNTTTEISKISRLISDVFPILEDKGVNIEELWKSIDDVVTLSIFSAYGYLSSAERVYCPSTTYPRCFQILGFDILLDRDLKPHVLEINYRPSLDFYRGKERRMKVAMIRDAILLGAPLSQIQTIINSRKWSWGRSTWLSYISINKDISNNIMLIRDNTEKTSGFALVWPSKDTRKEAWKDVLQKVLTISNDPLPSFFPSEKVAGGEA